MTQKEKQAKYRKQHYERNKEKIREQQRIYEASKRKEIKSKLERLEMLEAYLEQQGIAI